ncbi:MAG: hypothetical protein NXI31_00270 [bacterium]|nr:hypothetical protein [bacterium]
MLRTISTVLLTVLSTSLTSDLFAQGCATPGDTWWQRDRLPQVPTGLTNIGLVQGLDEGESIGVVFEMPANMAPQLITQVVVPWGAPGGVPGFVAALDVEVYDGVQFTGGQLNMGTRVFSLTQNLNANMQVTTTNLNVLDTSTYNIVVGTAPANGTPFRRRFAICFRTDINSHPTGSCQTGWPANYFTDATGFSITCDPQVTPPQTSIMEYRDSCGGAYRGWHDVTTATAQGVPVCPFYIRGIWPIRCCSRDAFPASYTTFGSGCAGTMPVSTLQPLALPRIGTTMNVIVNNLPDNLCFWLTGYSNTTSPLGPLPYDMGGIGAAGCNLLISPDAPQLLIANNNVVLTSLTLPNDAGFIGVSIYQQALVGDSVFNALGAVASDAATLLIGQ